MAEKESIGLDLDGVLYPWADAVATYCRMYKKYEGTDHEFWKHIDKYLTPSEQDYIVTVQDLYYRFSPSPRLLKLLEALDKKFNIFYITARPPEVQMVTEKYLRDFKFPQKENLIFSKDKDVHARLLNLQYFVEDSVRNAEKLKNICITFLVRTPYNEDYEGDLKVIDSVFELERILL
jgi:5'(3')-deoxyribonucleotidase